MTIQDLSSAPLGKSSVYTDQYDPTVLFPIPRQRHRAAMGIGLEGDLPFYGADIWHAYEVSWLDPKGKPVVAMAQLTVPATSPYLLESKSVKLYFNTFNQTRFPSAEVVQQTLCRDLSAAACASAGVELMPLTSRVHHYFDTLEGACLDALAVSCDVYQVDPALLKTLGGEAVCEKVFTHLFKSNCLVTGQPDWASVWIAYAGQRIDHAALLQYLVSFRQHNEFHEPCVERIFMDIQQRCQPTQLTVSAHFTRRGGVDINPYRSTEAAWSPTALRLMRQ